MLMLCFVFSVVVSYNLGAQGIGPKSSEVSVNAPNPKQVKRPQVLATLTKFSLWSRDLTEPQQPLQEAG